MSKSELTRRTLVASTAAIPAAAALPLPSAQAAADNQAAIVSRAEQVVELLRSKYVADGWQLNEQRAADFLDALRRLDFENDDSLEMKSVLDWVHDHGQSLDWIFQGDVAAMICAGAAHSVSAAPTSYFFA
jgi:predicted nucleic acid-binding protein